jgi:hypothetical protein
MALVFEAGAKRSGQGEGFPEWNEAAARVWRDPDLPIHGGTEGTQRTLTKAPGDAYVQGGQLKRNHACFLVRKNYSLQSSSRSKKAQNRFIMNNATPFLPLPLTLFAMLVFLIIVPSSRSQDITPPTAVSAQFGIGFESIFVTFSEPMRIPDALDRFNYLVAVNGFDATQLSGITVSDLDGRIFRLGLEHSPTPGSELTIYALVDLAGNTLSPNPTILQIAPVPEPSTIATAVLGTLMVVIFRRVRR